MELFKHYKIVLHTQKLDQIKLQFDNVRFTQLMTWLSETEPGWGYDVMQFRIEAAPEPANVSAVLTLEPQEL